MQRGNQLFVAGVASRLRYDREPPKCGKGAIYTLTDPEVNVRGTVVDNVIGPFDVDMYCVPTRPIEPFDSRKIIHDTIRRIEETGISVRMREPGDLGLVQKHRCASPSLRLNGGVRPSPARMADGHTLEEMDVRVRRAKIGAAISPLFVAGGVSLVTYGSLGGDCWCVLFCEDFVRPRQCNAAIGVGVLGIVGGVAGVIASSALIHRRKRDRDTLRRAHAV